METTPDNKVRWLNIRLKTEEHEAIRNRSKQTTCRNMSEFARQLLLGKAVTVLHRDRSMDEVLEELILLRKELNAIGNNLNQAVKSIHSTHGNADTRLWTGLFSIINSKLEPAIQHIKDRMNQYAELWSQKSKAGKA